MMGSDGQSAHHWPSVALSALLYFFFSTSGFLPDLSKMFSGRMHISSDFVYFQNCFGYF